MCVPAKSLQLCPTLCDPKDCNPADSSVHGILQARILEWVAMPSSRGSSQPRDRNHVSYTSYIGRWVLYPGATWEAQFGRVRRHSLMYLEYLKAAVLPVRSQDQHHPGMN